MADLNYRVTPTEQGKSISLPFGAVKPQGRTMAMWIAELRKSECCPVIRQIEVASLVWTTIALPETEQTSQWCSNSRTFEEPMNEAKQMTTAQAVGAASHTPGGFNPSPCELAANQYRVGLICTYKETASSFFMGAFLERSSRMKGNFQVRFLGD